MRLIGLALALVLVGQAEELTGDHELTFDFTRQGGDRAGHGEIRFSTTAAESGLTSGLLVIDLDSIVVPEAGDYEFVIDLDRERMGDLGLQAVQASPVT